MLQQFCLKAAMASAPYPAIAASVQDLLGLYGCWDQVIKVSMPGRGGVIVILGQGSTLPVALYEYEVVACVHDAKKTTEDSGLKWWLRTSNRSQAKQNRVESSWGTASFRCPHYRKGNAKLVKDNSRVSRHRSCKTSVRMQTCHQRCYSTLPTCNCDVFV
jgi:hypothetical protein